VHYEPNLDSVQEMKILPSNYQAKFGRNSGGAITAVTKGGSRDFHGTAQWGHRHEEFSLTFAAGANLAEERPLAAAQA
jgi:hypothetical protein